jgi:hypothetical protein
LAEVDSAGPHRFAVEMRRYAYIPSRQDKLIVFGLSVLVAMAGAAFLYELDGGRTLEQLSSHVAQLIG